MVSDAEHSVLSFEQDLSAARSFRLAVAYLRGPTALSSVCRVFVIALA